MGLDRFDIKDRESTLLTEAIVIVDKETGVNYLYVGRGYGGGLTPLLDADGKVVVTKAQSVYSVISIVYGFDFRVGRTHIIVHPAYGTAVSVIDYVLSFES